MKIQQHSALQGGKRWHQYRSLTVLLLSGICLWSALSHAGNEKDCEAALDKKGLFSRVAADAKDYWRHQVNLQSAVNYADRDLFTALANQGLILRGSIRSGEDAPMSAPSTKRLPMFDVNGREYVRIRLVAQGGTVTSTIEADVITGGRTYRVRLRADAPRVREFITAQGLTITASQTSSGGPYRESQFTQAPSMSVSAQSDVLATSQNAFGDLILMLARERGISQEILEKVDPRSLSLVQIQSGSFDMGSPEDEADRYSDESQHRVHLTKNFEMQSTAITQFVWFAVMGVNPSYFYWWWSCPQLDRTLLCMIGELDYGISGQRSRQADLSVGVQASGFGRASWRGDPV